MPPILDRYVDELIKDPDFEPEKDGVVRRYAAYAICSEKLKEAGKLESYDDIIKLSNEIFEEDKVEYKSLEFLGELKDIILKDSSDGEKKVSTIEIVKAGKFKHPQYGTLEFNEEKFNKFIDNFKSGTVGTDISFDAEHKPEKGAVAWLKDLFISHRIIDDVETPILSAIVEWTAWGEELIGDDLYKYFSIEFRENFIDSETGTSYGPTLLGGAITNRPFIKKLAPISLTEITNGIDQFDNDIKFSENDKNKELFDFFEDPFNSMSFRIRGMTTTSDGHVHTFVADINGQEFIGLTTATNEGDTHQHEINTTLSNLVTGNADSEDNGHSHKIPIQQPQLSEYLKSMELDKNSSNKEEDKGKKKDEENSGELNYNSKGKNKKKQSLSINKEEDLMTPEEKAAAEKKLKEEKAVEEAKLKADKEDEKDKEEKLKAHKDEEEKSKNKENKSKLSDDDMKKLDDASKALDQVPKLMELVEKQTETIKKLEVTNNKIEEERNVLSNDNFCKTLVEEGIPLGITKEVKKILNAKINSSGNFVLSETYEEDGKEKNKDVEFGLKDAIKRILDAIPENMRLDYNELTTSETNRDLGNEDLGVDMDYMRNKVLELAGVTEDK